MLLVHTFKGLLTGEEKTIENNDMTSPNGGYTQSYIDRLGKDYELSRAEELLGDSDIWEWVCTTLVVKSLKEIARINA